MKRKVCVVTGGRSDYGLLKWLMKAIQADNELELQIIATGMHLSPKFGFTLTEIEQDGFKVNEKIECLSVNDSVLDTTSAMAKTMTGCAQAYSRLRPELVLVLGDRFEVFAATSAALVANIPVAHLHGGEVTSGAIDESFRHAITKMSALHFVANEEYQHRVVQMGENPKHVFNVGGLGVDSILKVQPISKELLSQALNIKFQNRSLMVTFHPETTTNNSSASHITEVLNALTKLTDTTLIFTAPNADFGNSMITESILRFVKDNQDSYFFESLGQDHYFSILKCVDGVIGNSSSGLTEVPSFKIGTINIGDRQKGRIEATSVINSVADEMSITAAIKLLYSSEFQNALSQTVNPYGDGGASQRIIQILKQIPLDGITMKVFYDVQ
jgi:GDP/UDP-N,N'-diacetylbacillosamine 2-epimerase (hydrolysing)